MDVSSSPRTHLSVSVVLHSSPLPLLQRVVDSLRKAAETARQDGRLQRVSLFIVDNSSAGVYREHAARAVAQWSHGEFFELSYCPQPGNRGFGAGHNSAIQSVDSDYHLILNPDAELEEDALGEGLARLQSDEGIVLLSPRVTGGNGEQEFLCKRYPSVLVFLLRGFAPGFVQRLFRRRLADYEMRDLCSGDTPVEVDIASGCFMLVRTAALRAAGGFDEDYFLYFEDFDLSLRLRRQGRLVFDPAVRIVHHGGYAARKGLRHLRYFIASGLRFFSRNGWRWM